MDIKRTPVTSSAIAGIGHHAPSSTLAVEFKGGGVHHYAGVTAESHASLMGAKSIGAHFGKNFRAIKSTRPK